MFFPLHLSSVVQQAGSGKTYACTATSKVIVHKSYSDDFLLKVAHSHTIFHLGSNLQKCLPNQTHFLVHSAQCFDLAPIFGDLSQSEKHYEMKPPLVKYDHYRTYAQ